MNLEFWTIFNDGKVVDYAYITRQEATKVMLDMGRHCCMRRVSVSANTVLLYALRARQTDVVSSIFRLIEERDPSIQFLETVRFDELT